MKLNCSSNSPELYPVPSRFECRFGQSLEELVRRVSERSGMLITAAMVREVFQRWMENRNCYCNGMVLRIAADWDVAYAFYKERRQRNRLRLPQRKSRSSVAENEGFEVDEMNALAHTKKHLALDSSALLACQMERMRQQKHLLIATCFEENAFH